jgi:hypothetical protein
MPDPGYWTAAFEMTYRSHLKNRILVQNCGGAVFQTGGILLYFEDLKQGTNKKFGPKDIFEIVSNKPLSLVSRIEHRLPGKQVP